mmetsp:Transcript_18796/g.41823  ORF Transcript_18796/g.41823 Transcript_18796/m.41823 type:complete len:341 (-) Transcript_18796:114-1136(-)
MSKRGDHPRDSDVSDDDDEEWNEMFTAKGHLNSIEREVAWLAELARIDDEDGDPPTISSADGDDIKHTTSSGGEVCGKSNTLIDWSFVEDNASGDLCDFIESKGRAYDHNKKQVIIRSSSREHFDRYRMIIRQAFDEGFRPTQYKEIKRLRREVGGGKNDEKPRAKRDGVRVTYKETKYSEQKVIKCIRPNLKRGDKVVAAWFSSKGKCRWYNGVIADYKVIQTDKAFGEKRSYSIDFDDGDTTEGLDDFYVMSQLDYELDTQLTTKKRELKGVINHMEEKSDDEYAQTKGWYTTELTGKKEFASLSEAMRAYDKAIVKKKGSSVQETDLNLPMDYFGKK